MVRHKSDYSIGVPGCQATAELGDYVVDVRTHQHVGERNEQRVIQRHHLRRESTEGTPVLEPGLCIHGWLRVEYRLLRRRFANQSSDECLLLVSQLSFCEPPEDFIEMLACLGVDIVILGGLVGNRV